MSIVALSDLVLFALFAVSVRVCDTDIASEHVWRSTLSRFAILARPQVYFFVRGPLSSLRSDSPFPECALAHSTEVGKMRDN